MARTRISARATKLRSTGLPYQEAVSMFLRNCVTKNLSTNTIVYYRNGMSPAIGHLDRLHPALTPATTSADHLKDVVDARLTDILPKTGKRISAKTVNHTICALKAFFTYMWEEGYIPENPTAPVKKVKYINKTIQAFSDEQVKALLDGPDTTKFTGERDRLLLLVLLDSGLRISEALNIELGDIDRTSCTIRTIGKGGKERLVPFGTSARRALNKYLVRRGSMDHDLVFVNEFGEQMRRNQALQNMVKYGRSGGITGVRVSPHTCRHTFARNWIRDGGDPYTLQDVLGHTSMDMVRRYVTLANSDLQNVHKRVSPVDRIVGHEKEMKGRKRII
jgi:integrase/recombinase XerD